MTVKLIWRVSAAPTGRWRSFEGRAWPAAEVQMNGVMKTAAMITCEDDYVPRLVRLGKHAPLQVSIADWRQSHGFRWRRMTARFNTLQEAKNGAQIFLDAHPYLLGLANDAK